MAVRSLFSTISEAATSAVDSPVRSIVEAVLEERGLVDRSEFDAARTRLEGLEARLAAVSPRLEAAEQRASHLADEVRRFQSTVDDLQRDLSDAREQTVQALARADETDRAVAKLRAELEELKAAPAASAKAAPSAAVVGPNGEVDVRGKEYTIDAKHAGEQYTIAHNGAVRVGRRLVKKQAVKN
ncbi:MAG TPA: hypothetical protein DFR83_13700 [Deltaproteobacteria bacterium]|nr:hypothetical protein [Deltaproteobacteria bacterium]